MLVGRFCGGDEVDTREINETGQVGQNGGGSEVVLKFAGICPPTCNTKLKGGIVWSPLAPRCPHLLNGCMRKADYNKLLA